METFSKTFRAPEIFGDFWFNTEPVSISALRGEVILLHFWDFTSLNSLRTLPYVQEWHRRYTPFGFNVVGVHTPEFPFARDPILVRQAIEKLNIRYSIVMDNDYIIWQMFKVRMLPTIILIDKDGFVRFQQTGGGSFHNIEHSIQTLITEAGYYGELPLIMEPITELDREGVIVYKPSPSIFAGYQRGALGNIEGYVPECVYHYKDPGYYFEGKIYLEGTWFLSRNYIKLAEDEGNEGSVIILYKAKDVFSVIRPEGETQFQVFIQQDGKYLTNENKGDEIKIDQEGRSYILVKDTKLYNIVKNPEYGEHILRMSTRSNGFTLYAISFLTSPIPEFILNY